MNFGEWLRGKRQARGLSLVELGALVGVTDVQISRIETGSRSPSYETALKLARVFGENSSRVLKMAGHTPVETVNAG